MTALHVNQDKDLADVTVLGSDGASVLHTTQHHPFWNESRNQWTDAADLRPTDRLHAADGSVQIVLRVVVFTGDRQMRDLTVGYLHTYYVVAGGTPILVHNCPNPLLGWDQWDVGPGNMKSALGPASAWGSGMTWEHVVERSQYGLSGFDRRIINHPENVVLMRGDLNTAKGEYYGRTLAFTEGMSLRRWIAKEGWSYDQQRSFGMYVINTLESGGTLPG